MTRFIPLSDTVSVSPQISATDIETAAREGFDTVINNRPDGEEAGQPTSAQIEAAAREAGLTYLAIPIGASGFTDESVRQMSEALDTANRTLAYCRSGTRSTYLWALASASQGVDTDDLVAAAAGAGYDLAPLLPRLELLSAQDD